MELWDVLDNSGNKTGRQMERTSSIPQGDYHLCAELWLLDCEGRFLLQQRAPDKRTLPGAWTMTTGCILAGEDSHSGILREAKEELGLSLRKEDLFLIRRVIHGNILWDIWATRLDQPVVLTLQIEEVTAARWVTLAELRNLMASGGVFIYPEMEQVLSDVLTRFGYEAFCPSAAR